MSKTYWLKVADQMDGQSRDLLLVSAFAPFYKRLPAVAVAKYSAALAAFVRWCVARGLLDG